MLLPPRIKLESRKIEKRTRPTTGIQTWDLRLTGATLYHLSYGVAVFHGGGSLYLIQLSAFIHTGDSHRSERHLATTLQGKRNDSVQTPSWVKHEELEHQRFQWSVQSECRCWSLCSQIVLVHQLNIIAVSYTHLTLPTNREV